MPHRRRAPMTPRSRSLPAVVILVVALLAVAAALVFVLRGPTLRPAPGAAATRPTAPDPSLTPDQVVAAVLAALKNNDPATDDGVRTTFRFASPANQRVTG